MNRHSPHSRLLSRVSLLFLGLLIPIASQIQAAEVYTIETSAYVLKLSTDGQCAITDRQSGIEWKSPGPADRFGQATVLVEGKPRQVNLDRCTIEKLPSRGLTAVFHPLTEKPTAAIRVTLRAPADKGLVAVSFEADPELQLQSVSLLDDLFAATASGGGYVLVPTREGLLIPADSDLSFTHRFDTSAYEGCHMQMLGVVEQGSAVLLTWPDVYMAADIKSVTTAAQSKSQRISASLNLRKTANAFEVRFLGRGDYVAIAEAYRGVAEERGLLVSWKEKLKSNPERAKLFGAINYKLWSTLDRRMNEDSSKELSVRLNWTFPEAALVAEHLKNDLKLDKVLFTMGGWIQRGYDNQHPDALPTAPECGGDTAFADCAKRVMDLGYLFCLHDNYQDIYRDSPSWDERFVMKTPDGKLARGGHWAGGVAFLTCAKMALELAQRPQNLTAIKKLSGANSYFIDTTYAAGLQECFDKEHPLTRADDMKWKIALSDYAREVFGIFGSECGREWAIPHADFFEGLTGVSGGYYHDANLVSKLGATVVPLFELVYHDCLAMYGKYGYDPFRAAGYVLHHISLARPLNYHSIPAHIYWTNTAAEAGRLPIRPGIVRGEQTAPRKFDITYRWQVQKALEPKADSWRVFVHFTDNSREIKFQNDHTPNPPLDQWQPGELIQGPMSVTVPEGLAGTFNVRMGLFDPVSGERASLQGRDNNERSYSVGRLIVKADGAIEFQPQDPPAGRAGDAALFTRGDNGWTDGLHSMDRFVKNTYEILSPLNELTSQMPMTGHAFLTPDRSVQKSEFGAGKNLITVIANGGSTDFVCSTKLGGEIVLPPFGFVIEAPTFAAFYARSWNGVAYADPPLFTMQSLDGKPLSGSKKIRVYHAFGAEQLALSDKTVSVTREAIVE